MLFRNPDVPVRHRVLSGIRRAMLRLGAIRRRRRAVLDIAGLSPYLRRDLGLDGVYFR